MKTITSIMFVPTEGQGTIYALSGAFTESIPVIVANLPQDIQVIINQSLQELQAQLPEGTTSVTQIGLERSVLTNEGQESIYFNIEAVAVNAANGVAVIKVSASEATIQSLNIVWNELQALINK
jgi:hypothetical protein